MSICRRDSKRLRVNRVVSGIALVIGMASCSDDVNVNNGNYDYSERGIVINFSLPDFTSVITRAGTETDINTIDAFVFEETNNSSQADEYTRIAFKHYENTEISDNSVTLRLGGDLRHDKVLVYLVANGDAGVQNLQTIDALRTYLLSSSVDLENGLPMVGYKEIETMASEDNLTLVRSVAKVSAICNVAGASLEGLNIYHNSEKGYLASALNKEENQYVNNIIDEGSKSSVAPVDADFANAENFDYSYPSNGFNYTAGGKDGAFVILKVNRNSKDQYYRINLRKEKEDGDKDEDGYLDEANGLIYLHLMPNHHYQVEITDFFTDGYDSAEEAARHPESDQFVVYKIHDHAAEVLSMITDGYRELGVTPEIKLTSSLTTESLVVKIFSPDEVDYDKTLTIENDLDWLFIGEKIPHVYEGDYNQTWEPDSPGMQYEYEIGIKSGSRTYEDMSGEITVKWMGLKRKITIKFEASFQLYEVCTVNLTMYDSDDKEKAQIKDYLTFVTGQGESFKKDGTGTSLIEKANTPHLYGILPTEMIGEKKRSNGFHFPMPYGEKKNGDKLEVAPWKYVYSIDFTNLAQLNDTPEKISGIEAKIEGDEFIINNVKWNYEGENKVKLTLDSSASKDYTYAGGRIIFTVSYENSETTSEIITSLYHTGFFHYEENTKYAPSTALGYYYYEVVPMADGFWLDRNIGATSNKSYIDTEDATAEKGREAAGRHYTIIDEPKPFELPVWDFKMIPPGYHIPNSTEWDILRLHDNFKTQSVTLNRILYMTTYYVTGNEKIGNIYFQKARFRNEKNLYLEGDKYNIVPNSGDAGAGYYWSVTEAPAMEKEQMGNWLRALYLNGSSSTYVNSSVTDHRMPIRCKSGTQDDVTDAQEYHISFNVHNVTHVYLFEKGNSKPLYNFPGRAVGTSASSEYWQHFSCTTTVAPEELMMLFVKLDSSGKVYIYHKDPSGKDGYGYSNSYNKAFLSDTYAWAIDGGAYYDFCEVGKERKKNPFTKADEEEWANDCGMFDDSGSSSGGSGGGGDTGEDNNKHLSDFTYKKQYDYEKDLGIIQEDYSYSGYGQFRMENCGSTSWSSIPANSILRVYTGICTDSYKVILRTNWWTELATITSSQTYDYEGQAVIEIKLTQDLLNTISQQGGFVLECWGNCILGITITDP